MRLSGKTALITGAGSGLGQATAQLFAQEGAHVIVADISQRRADAVAAEISQTHASPALGLQADVTQRRAVRALVEQAKSAYGPINILVNNAGIAQIKDLLDITPEDWQRMIDVHMKGTFLCTRAVIGDMISAQWGRVINTASVAGMTGGPQNAHYAAAKAAIIGFTRSLALEYARSGITVNAVAPGLIETPMVKQGTGPCRREGRRFLYPSHSHAPDGHTRRHRRGSFVSGLGRGGLCDRTGVEPERRLSGVKRFSLTFTDAGCSVAV